MLTGLKSFVINHEGLHMHIRTFVLAAFAVLIFGSNALAAPVYAQKVESYDKGLGVNQYRDEAAYALGAPDNVRWAGGDDIRFVSLGRGSANTPGGSLVLSFGDGVTFTGWATIYEATYSRAGYNEFATVLGSSDGVNWTSLGDIDNQNVDADGGFTINFSGTFSQLKIVDTCFLEGGVLSDGFDVDAVKVNATPIPGAAWLLGSGLIGLVGLRRRFVA